MKQISRKQFKEAYLKRFGHIQGSSELANDLGLEDPKPVVMEFEAEVKQQLITNGIGYKFEFTEYRALLGKRFRVVATEIIE